jgi:hypothetical protein
MAERMRWWVIPGAMVVLLRVVTLDGPRADTLSSRDMAEQAAADGLVVLQDASGQLSGAAGPGAAEAEACIVSLPADRKGLRGVTTVWRRLDGERERAPWLVLRSRVRSDATVPMPGLGKGRYDLEMVFGDGQAGGRFVAQDVAVPGTVTLREAP